MGRFYSCSPTPLLLYVEGVEAPQVAIGTSALAVSINAATNLFHHVKGKNLKFGKGLTFATPGVVGTIISSHPGLLTPSSSLIFFFAFLMLVIAAKMLISKPFRRNLGDNHESSRKFINFDST